MEYVVIISDVSGDSYHECKKSNATEALQFLSYYDHEGSSVSIEIHCDAEEGFNLLNELEKKEVNK